MFTKILDKKVDYDGSQLRSHWIFDTIDVTGDTVLAFIGGCDVSLEHMVDLADKKQKCSIFSESMLHFIAEFFGPNMNEMILHQRLFVSILADAIRRHVKDVVIVRKGNDLYDNDAKINVSIATASTVSTLMHVGVNIESRNTPVKTKGLKDYGVEPKMFAEEVLQEYKKEVEGMSVARCKVRGVN